MREIKFRYIHAGEARYYTIAELYYGYWDKAILHPEDFAGEFTGLHDKNGKEIYEGDILEGGFKECFVVKWKNGRWIDSTSLDEDAGVESALWQGNGGALEYKKVVGNIYENPELLNSHSQ